MTITEILSGQREFFNSNETKPTDFRISQLKKLKKLLKENEGLLYEAIYADFGKSEFETYLTELSLVYHEINSLIRNIKKYSRRRNVPTNLANFPARSYIIPEPLGCTLIIGAWNYPYQLSLVPAITSLAAGNTVIVKPSELPARTSEVMAKIINANFPSTYFAVVEGGVEISTELLEEKFDKIFFTGSTRVGKIVYQAAAKQLTPVTLELGGKSPTFVLPSCNMNITVQRIVWSKFINAGQSCVAPDYILVHESVEQKFIEAVKKEIEKNYNTETNNADNYLKIINTSNFERLNTLLNSGEICFGGKVDKETRFVSPTIMKNVSFGDEIMKDEVFGPILPVISFTDLGDTIDKVKRLPKPLSCYVYSKDRKEIKKVLNEISFGGGGVNESVVHIANSKLPFGGVGMSGIGNYHGEAGFRTFSHFKSIIEKSVWIEWPFRYAPYSEWKRKLMSLLLE